MAEQVKITMIGSKYNNKDEMKRAYDASLAFLTKYNNGWLVSGHAVGIDNTAELAAVEASGVVLEKEKVNRVDWEMIKKLDLASPPKIIMYLPDFSPDYYSKQMSWLLPVNFENMPSTMTTFPPKEAPSKGNNLASFFNPKGTASKTFIRALAQVLGTGSPKSIVNGVAYSDKPSFYTSKEDGKTYLSDEIISGDTGQTVRLALFLGLPCWNLSDQKQYAEFMNLVANGQIPAQRQFRDNIEDSYEALEYAIEVLKKQGAKIEKFEDIAGMRLRGFFKDDGNLRLEPIPEEEIERFTGYTFFPVEVKNERNKGQKANTQNKEYEERMLYSVYNNTPIVTSITVKMKDVPPEQLAEKLQQTIDAIVTKATAEGKKEKRFYGLNVLDFSKVEKALQPETFQIQTPEGVVSFNDLFTSRTNEFKKNKNENSKYFKPKSLYYNFLYIAGLIQYFNNNPESQKTLGQYNAYSDPKNGLNINAVSPAEALNLYYYMKKTGLLGKVYNQHNPETNERLPLTSTECFDTFRETMIEKYYLPKLKMETNDRLWALQRSLNSKKITQEDYTKKKDECIKRALEFAKGLGIEDPKEADFMPSFEKQNNTSDKAQSAETIKKYNNIFGVSDESTPVKVTPAKVNPVVIKKSETPVATSEKKDSATLETVTEVEQPKTSSNAASSTKIVEPTAEEKTPVRNPAGARKGNTAAKRARVTAGRPEAF